MPKKQNGFGNSKSLAFKPSKAVSKGKGVGAAGFYPSDRRYGTAVQRSVIEKYDLDSDWTKWRRGFEYYNKAIELNPQHFKAIFNRGFAFDKMG